MIVDLPNTTTAAISKKLVAAARGRRRDRPRPGAHPAHRRRRAATPRRPSRRPTTPAAQHPCRIIAVVTRQQARRRAGSTPRSASAATPAPARSSCCGCTAPLADHGDSVVIPLLLPDAPVVAWWPGERARRRLGRTRSARWPSAGSPTPPRPRNPHKELQRRAGDLPAGRHRPRLDPRHAVARPARRRARPAAVRAGHRGHRHRRQRLPLDRPAGRLAGPDAASAR